jgi:hypothetical protein
MTETTDKPRRRFVVGKMFFALMVLFLLASAAGRMGWGWYADRQNQAVIDEIRQRGEPATWREMQPPAVPDDKNAVEIYKRILAMPELKDATALRIAPKSALLGATTAHPPGGNAQPQAQDEWVVLKDTDHLANYGSGEWLWAKLESDAEFRHKHTELAAMFFSMVEQPLALARKARGMKADFKGDYGGSYYTFQSPEVVGYQELARALVVAAHIAHDRGDDARAVEYLRDGQAVGESMYSLPTMIGQMVGVGIDRIMTAAVEGIAPTLKVGPAPAASPEQVRVLMAQLLATQSAQDNLARALMGERISAQDAVKMILENPVSVQGVLDSNGSEQKTPAPAIWLLDFVTGPMWTMQATEHMRHMNLYVAQAKLGRYPPSKISPPAYLDGPGSLKSLTHTLNMALTPALSHGFFTQYRGFSYRRMAATALAIRMCECEHGRRPMSLTELCPEYLPAMPEDPFDLARKGVKYLPSAKHPILYVVGQDQKDDGGQYRLTVDKNGVDQETLDIPFFLNGTEDREQAIRELSSAPAGGRPVLRPRP